MFLEQKSKSDKPEKKVRQTRWNNDPPVPVINAVPFVSPVFNGLTLQDQQKLQEYQVNISKDKFISKICKQKNLSNKELISNDMKYMYIYFFVQMNFQMKGFYSEQDQDMRVSSNGDVDMRSLPLSQKPETSKVDVPASLVSNMDVDVRTPLGLIGSPLKTDKNNEAATKSEVLEKNKSDAPLTIDEKLGS